MSNSIYTYNGNEVGTLSETIYIEDLKKANPLSNDDQLLDIAIEKAKANGITSIIKWDGTDIHFNGSATHVLKGFGGIDFCNSKIYMPNYDIGIILSIEPDETEDITVSASDILKTNTTYFGLKNKVFKINNNQAGNEDMCLGDRAGSFESIIYYTPTVKTTPTGYYMTGDLYLVPSSGDVICYNVHEYPNVTFEICNAKVVSNSNSNMSLLISCKRSNTHIHNIQLEGRSGITSYHHGVMRLDGCCGIEIDHISGVNPVQEELTSGYAIGLYSVSFAYIHDCYIGDDLSWGVVGSNHLTNTVFERCHLNRWDCHYAQYGYNVVRECVLNHIQYGIGSGTLKFENCTIIENRTSDSVVTPISLRSDTPGVYDGNIIVSGCTFISVSQPASGIILWLDANYYEIPANSKVTGAPKKKRIIERCNVPSGCKSIFKVGSRIANDQNRYANIEYVIKDMDYNCSDVVVDAYDSNQVIGAIAIEGCRSEAQCYITNLISNAIVRLLDTNFENKTIHLRKNINEISVNQCRFNSVLSDEISSFLMITGCRLYGSQDFSKFSNYSAYGNVASSRADTPALNTHVT